MMKIFFLLHYFDNLKIFLFLFVAPFVAANNQLSITVHPNSAITMKMQTSSSRLGNQLLAYMQAKWLSYIFKIPFIFTPFSYSNELALHYSDPLINNQKKKSKEIKMQSESVQEALAIFKKFCKKSALYVVCFNYYYPGEYRNNPEFMQLIRALVAPIKPLDLITAPSNYASIALHVRTGVGFDSESAKKQSPEKFPSSQAYACAIQKALDLITVRPLFIQIFTDHPSPEEALSEIKKNLVGSNKSTVLNEQNIIWRWREFDNRHDKNVLTDLFSMAYNFDCLICPKRSTYAQTAEILGDHALVIRVGPNANEDVVTLQRKSRRYTALRINEGENESI